MSVTSGFYNSLNHDRTYDAIQMSSIFDGIIMDGVYQSIGDAFSVKATTGNNITVGTGRAWFNHSWTLNDALLPIELEDSELLLDRYDAVVLEINGTDEVRENSIKVIKGTPASSPQYPTLTKSGGVYQYPLAYILRGAESTSVTQANITNRIGTEDCPFVTGPLNVISIDFIVDQWGAQWAEWLQENEALLNTWMSENQEQFESWFENLQVTLAGDVAANLAAQILELQNMFSNLISDQSLYFDLETSTGDPLETSAGTQLEGHYVYVIK